MSEPVISEFKTAFELGTKQAIQQEINGVPVLVVPRDMAVHVQQELADLSLKQPRYLKQSVSLLTAEAFVNYFNRFADEHSTVFYNPETGKFTGYLDFHASKDQPEFLRHKCYYTCPKTVEWNAWIKNNNQKMNQEEFALFIEDNLKQIAEPDGATMLEIASSLKATNNVDFRSATSLSNGQVQFTYNETINGQAGAKGNLEIPQIIKINIKPFMNGAPYEVQARFRYRISAQGLQLYYTLISPHLIIEDAVNDVLEVMKIHIDPERIIEGELI